MPQYRGSSKIGLQLLCNLLPGEDSVVVTLDKNARNARARIGYLYIVENRKQSPFFLDAAERVFSVLFVTGKRITVGFRTDDVPLQCWVEWFDYGLQWIAETRTDYPLIDLQGPPGADGADGAPGADGADGAPGADGADGATGATGATGAAGTDGALAVKCAVKTADESRSNNTTMTSDTHLSVSGLAAGNYLFELNLVVNFSNASRNLKWGQVTSSFNNIDYLQLRDGAAENLGLSGGSSPVSVLNSGEHVVQMFGLASVSSNGSYTFQWAQNAAGTNTIIMRKNSYLKFTRFS